MLKQKIARILFRWHGWKLVGRPIPPETHRCVFVFAPHTSNWDFYFGTLCMMSWGIPIKVAIKKFWTRFPFSLVIKPMGGVGVDRSAKRHDKDSQVRNMAAVFQHYEKIAFVITPEGSRDRREQWKTGFYHIAQTAQVPIVTLSGNFAHRTVEFGPVFLPGTDLDIVMTEIMRFYKGAVALYPEKFALDERWAEQAE